MRTAVLITVTSTALSKLPARSGRNCQAKRQIAPDRWQRVRIEFEYESKDLLAHHHPADRCDLIVCWRHNWPSHPPHLQILDLSRAVKPFTS